MSTFMYTPEQLERIYAAMPEGQRPRIISAPETPDPKVANLLSDVPYAQPLRVVDGKAVEVLFADFPYPSAPKVEAVRGRLSCAVLVAVAHPANPRLFTEIHSRAVEMRGDVAGWVESVLEVAVRAGASDVRIGVGDLPLLRTGGVGLMRISDFPQVTPEQAEQAAFWAAKRRLDPEDPGDMDIDTGLSVTTSQGVQRMRANVYREKQQWAIALRFIPEDPPPFETLGLPEAVRRIIEFGNGLVLVTGTVNSGKSTTIASLIDMINGRDTKNILTIENPIEFIHKPRRSTVHQREVGTDTEGFTSAMRSALRQSPDIVLVGEIRNYEEIAAAVTLAETGQLVLATLHTNSAAQTVSRLVDVFPASQQNQIRTQISMTLRAVVSQHLFPRLDEPNKGVVACEVMFVTDAIAAIIRSGEFGKLIGAVIDARSQGMIPMDWSLADLVHAGKISEAAALPYVTRQEMYKSFLREMGAVVW